MVFDGIRRTQEMRPVQQAVDAMGTFRRTYKELQAIDDLINLGLEERKKVKRGADTQRSELLKEVRSVFASGPTLGLSRSITKLTFLAKIGIEEIADALPTGTNSEQRKLYQALEKIESSQETAAISALNKLAQNFWRIKTNSDNAKVYTELLNENEFIPDIEAEIYSQIMTSDRAAFPFMYSFEGNMDQIYQTDQRVFLTHIVASVLSTLREGREHPTEGNTVGLPKRVPIITVVNGERYKKIDPRSTKDLYKKMFSDVDHVLEIPESEVSAARKGGDTLTNRENKRRVESDPLATDLIVNIRKIKTVKGQPVWPSLTEVVNSKELLTGRGALAALDVYVNEDGFILGSTIKYNHQFTSGYEGSVESKQMLDRALDNSLGKGEARPLDYKEPPSPLEKSKPLKTKIRGAFKGAIDSLPTKNKESVEDEVCFETEADIAQLFTYSKQLNELKERAQMVIETGIFKDNGQTFRILSALLKTDTSVPALVHMLLMMSTNHRTGHFLERKRQGDRAGNIGVTASVNPFWFTDNPSRTLFYNALIQLNTKRKNIKNGEPGEVDYMDFATRGFQGKVRTFLRVAGSIFDRNKKELLANTMFSSLLIGNNPLPEEQAGAQLRIFATALPTDNYEVTCGGVQTSGTNVGLSARCLSRHQKKYEDFEIRVLESLIKQEDYLKDEISFLSKLISDTEEFAKKEQSYYLQAN